MYLKKGLLALTTILAFLYMISSVSATDYTVDASVKINLEVSTVITWVVTTPTTSPFNWKPLIIEILNFIKELIPLISAAFAKKVPIATEKAKEILKKIKAYIQKEKDETLPAPR
jgi:hypothetical protein